MTGFLKKKDLRLNSKYFVQNKSTYSLHNYSFLKLISDTSGEYTICKMLY